MLYEDGVPVGWPYVPLNDIAKHGGGRYCHLGDELLFSTTDHSNPRTNGRTYTICADFI